jgi:hypothetical protein
MQPLPQHVAGHRIVRLGKIYKTAEETPAPAFVLLNKMLQHKGMVSGGVLRAEPGLSRDPHPRSFRPSYQPVVKQDGIELGKQRHHGHRPVVAPLTGIAFLKDDGVIGSLAAERERESLTSTGV